MEEQPVIIKRVKKGHGGHHGGAWKVAYADFVTALMALFLVLWVVAMMSAETRKAVAEYFRSFSMIEGENSLGGDKISHMPGEVILLQDTAGGVQGGTSWQRRLEESIKRQLEANLKEARDQVYMTVISGGVRIELVERTGKAMFGLGEARLLPHGERLLEIIAQELIKLPYPIWIEGHTDAYPYRKGSYTNWELSVDRANVVRKKLVATGVAQDRIMKVIGYAATDPLLRDDPYSPLNRRVSIVVKEKRDSALKPSPVTETEAAAGPSGGTPTRVAAGIQRDGFEVGEGEPPAVPVDRGKESSSIPPSGEPGPGIHGEGR